MSEKPIKSLGHWYDASLRDTVQVDQIREDTISSLMLIDNSLLPSRLKLWCLQFGLFPGLVWTLTIYNIPLSKVDKLERLVSTFAKKWLGLLGASPAQHCMGKEFWNFQCRLADEFKCSKVRLEMTLVESRDPAAAQTIPTVSAGRKWSSAAATRRSLIVPSWGKEALKPGRGDHLG